MKASDVDPTIREWLYAREMLRRLGFSPDDLFFAVAPSGNVLTLGQPMTIGTPVITLELRAQGKTFEWTIGPTAVPLAKLEAAYRDACALWNAGSDAAVFDAEFRSSRPMQRKVGLGAALREKGFELP
jgi:hypothetical protein